MDKQWRVDVEYREVSKETGEHTLAFVDVFKVTGTYEEADSLFEHDGDTEKVKPVKEVPYQDREGYDLVEWGRTVTEWRDEDASEG